MIHLQIFTGFYLFIDAGQEELRLKDASFPSIPVPKLLILIILKECKNILTINSK